MDQTLDPSERAELNAAVDRLEERIETARDGLHSHGGRAEPGALEDAGLPPGAALLWARYDGLELMCGEARLHAVAEIEAATLAAQEEGLLAAGDRVIGERGRDLFVLPQDPWAEGASVVSISEEAERAPEATSVAHLLLGLWGETAVLYDEYGEFHDGLIDDSGDLLPSVKRKLLRRRLDLDPYAPAPRLRLAQILREAGELRGALKEIKKVLHYAPEFAAAHAEHGWVAQAMERTDDARRAFAKAAEFEGDEANAASYQAWAALVSPEGEQRQAHAAAVVAKRPDFVLHQLKGAQAHFERGSREPARTLVSLGLAVAPRQLELLELRRQLELPVPVAEPSAATESADDPAD